MVVATFDYRLFNATRITVLGKPLQNENLKTSLFLLNAKFPVTYFLNIGKSAIDGNTNETKPCKLLHISMTASLDILVENIPVRKKISRLKGKQEIFPLRHVNRQINVTICYFLI